MSKVILVNGQNVELAPSAQTSGTGYLNIPDLAGGTKYLPLAASAAHAAELAKLGVHGADIASASTTNLETATGELVDVTGTTAITALTLSEGHRRIVRFTGILTLTHGASLVLPGAANIITAAGDVAVFEGYASSVVRCVGYTRAAAEDRRGYLAANATLAVGTGLANMSFTLPDGTTAAGFAVAAGEIWKVDADFSFFHDDGGGSPDGTIRFQLSGHANTLFSGLVTKFADLTGADTTGVTPSATFDFNVGDGTQDISGNASISATIVVTTATTIIFKMAAASASTNTGLVYKGGGFIAKRLKA